MEVIKHVLTASGYSHIILEYKLQKDKNGRRSRRRA
jgi:hypothetical protein